jgi:predicted phosphodiesterase
MRLALGSDLHVDTWPGAKLRWQEAPDADVLLLAGDLHDDQAGSAAVLRKAAEVRATWW